MKKNTKFSLVFGLLFPGAMGCGFATNSAPASSDVAVADALGTPPSKGLGVGIEIYRPSPKTEAVSRTMEGSNYELAPQSFPRERVAEFQKPGTDKTGTPKDLQGIWWMDGNSACSCTVSFAEVDFSADYPIMSNFSENNFSYQGGNGPTSLGQKGDSSFETGIKSFNSAASTNSVYEFHFKGEGPSRYHQAEIMPVMKINVFGVPLGVRFKPSVVKFGLKKINDNLYLRENFVLGVKVPGEGGEYRFKRILKPSSSNPDQLERTEHWDEFVGPQRGKKVISPAMLRMPRNVSR